MRRRNRSATASADMVGARSGPGGSRRGAGSSRRSVSSTNGAARTRHQRRVVRSRWWPVPGRRWVRCSRWLDGRGRPGHRRCGGRAEVVGGWQPRQNLGFVTVTAGGSRNGEAAGVGPRGVGDDDLGPVERRPVLVDHRDLTTEQLPPRREERAQRRLCRRGPWCVKVDARLRSPRLTTTTVRLTVRPGPLGGGGRLSDVGLAASSPEQTRRQHTQDPSRRGHNT